MLKEIFRPNKWKIVLAVVIFLGLLFLPLIELHNIVCITAPCGPFRESVVLYLSESIGGSSDFLFALIISIILSYIIASLAISLIKVSKKAKKSQAPKLFIG